jgi:hypothetical protein
MKKSLLLLLVLSTNVMALPVRFELPIENTDLIYGSDDRYEVSEYSNPVFVSKARSVALKVSNKRLSEDREDPTLVNFATRKLKQTIPQICPTERFIDQVSLGDCSGFLISPTKLVTAGHCMLTQAECTGSKWVFDFRAETKVFKKSDVYSCKKIVVQKFVYDKKQVSDYAIIELDRPVFNRPTLDYRKHGIVDRETSLVVIGHPMGLPMKITDGGRVTGMNDLELDHRFLSAFQRRSYFTTNIDSYAGNSGSPVFNYETGKVEGILIQGADDFIFNQEKSCLESRHLSNSALNSYEKVMRINHVPGL